MTEEYKEKRGVEKGEKYDRGGGGGKATSRKGENKENEWKQ